MAERWDYPVTSPTTNFIPTIDARPAGSPEVGQSGIVADQSSGQQEYRYTEGARFKTIDRSFENNPGADKTAWEAFLAAVGGDVCKFTDYLAAMHTVSFGPEDIQYTPGEAGRYSWKIRMREEL